MLNLIYAAEFVVATATAITALTLLVSHIGTSFTDWLAR